MTCFKGSRNSLLCLACPVWSGLPRSHAYSHESMFWSRPGHSPLTWAIVRSYALTAPSALCRHDNRAHSRFVSDTVLPGSAQALASIRNEAFGRRVGAEEQETERGCRRCLGRRKEIASNTDPADSTRERGRVLRMVSGVGAASL